MSDIRTPQNPGIGGLDELTLEEELLIQQLAALGDPNADRILFWDDSEGEYAYLAPGTNLSISGTTLNATGGSGGGYTVTSVTGATHNEAGVEGIIVLLCDATAQNITVNLPTAVSNLATIVVKKVDSSSNTVTIDGDTTETIDGGATAVIRVQYASVDLISDDTNWRII